MGNKIKIFTQAIAYSNYTMTYILKTQIQNNSMSQMMQYPMD